MRLLRVCMLASLTLIGGGAQAGVLEDLLALPAIQSLLGRQSDLRSAILRCNDPNYRQRNEVGCRQADEARALAAMPPELRMVMSNTKSSASLRELCLFVQNAPLQNSHLCAELYKAESEFRKMADIRRLAPAPTGLSGGDLSR